MSERLTVLTLNEGSSSLKFGLYAAGSGAAALLAEGAVDTSPGHDESFDRIEAALGGVRPGAIGHRIVHGGPDLFEPALIDAAVIAKLEAATDFAPLHGPAALALIRAAAERYPELPQVACFDTGFHAHLPDVAAVLPIPKALRSAGIRRYGFHGLSCQSIVHQLGSALPDRLIIAHLGSGASVTAVRAGRSVDTSMGLTPSGGVVMATRAGDLDPGVLLYLMRVRGMDAGAIEALVDGQSGMLGISGRSGDLRRLHAAGDADAALAIAIFCRSVAKQIAAMMAALGGADLIVFTGGIGEHDGAVRDAIRADLAWAGPVATQVLPSREGEQIARGAAAALGVFMVHKGWPMLREPDND
ncbi:acetate kinase [Sphingomonas oligophenolica]|uniref:Acetate kinase n=1 Tax=Sphingomonas oligophenolica TaxID=301154 RepID=A0ABU9Y0P7_9SPHN